jgi:hypothetical protein
MAIFGRSCLTIKANDIKENGRSPDYWETAVAFSNVN